MTWVVRWTDHLHALRSSQNQMFPQKQLSQQNEVTIWWMWQRSWFEFVSGVLGPLLLTCWWPWFSMLCNLSCHCWQEKNICRCWTAVREVLSAAVRNLMVCFLLNALNQVVPCFSRFSTRSVWVLSFSWCSSFTVMDKLSWCLWFVSWKMQKISPANQNVTKCVEWLIPTGVSTTRSRSQKLFGSAHNSVRRNDTSFSVISEF